jgi:flagellar hook-associated protein 2
LNSNFAGVQALFSDSSQGFANRFYTKLDGYISTTGLISNRTEGLNQRISELDKQKLNLENRMAIIEKRYRAQFTALDTLISSMNSTSSFLTQQLAGLPGSSSK